MNIYFIGYRGTGKSTLGKKVAKALGKEFVDLDEIIVRIAGKKIPQIFSESGEEKFREYETRALEEFNGKEFVVACGGGIIVKEQNIPILKSNGVVCLLKLSPEEIHKRINGDSNRPSLTGKTPFEEIKFLLEKRREGYEQAKDFEIDCNNKGIRKCTEEILLKLKEFKK